MDLTAIAWYAAICGALSALLAPLFGGRTTRIIVGAAVGIIAASLFPLAKTMMGY
ncbi:MAG: hypothetical protein JJ858_06695 [Rhizobiaceae bacterium]|nr:hypothetical protein [Rhizobiaceae bacterium]